MQIKTFDEYQAAYQLSVDDPEGFWAKIAVNFEWQKKWDTVLDWNFTEPKIRWFDGGQMNVTINCLDRHLKNQANKTAIIWESNSINEKSRSLTYQELHSEVCKFANVLKSSGLKKGDTICIYMPMVPELIIASLACARIGVVHTIVFSGFSAKAVADRIINADCKMVITSDGAFRAEKIIPLKAIINEALEMCEKVKKVIVLKRTGSEIEMKTGRDFWWHHEMENQNTDCTPEIMESEDPLFILYTSGSTGVPKGVVHSTAGYLIYAHYTFVNVFQYQPDDLFFCTADLGWITGHTYIMYGPLSAGATVVLFEGVPTFPDAGRFWEIIDKHQVTIFHTAPTAIRSLMAFGENWVENKSLKSLRIIGSVGEPINEEAWHWYDDHIGKNNCPIVDTWWQTETGGMMISPLAGIGPVKPSFALLPLPGVQPILVDEKGEILEGDDVSGNLCIKFPWPGMARTTFGDHDRFRETYFSTYKNFYFTGDGCLRDKDGHYRITGRVDDVINVSGHRIGTAEVEDAIDEHELVIESAVVGFPHPVKGQAIYAYVILTHKTDNEELLFSEIKALVSKSIGGMARPDKIQIVNALPKTRSGKIMRRILRKIAEGDVSNLGDTSTLLDSTVVDDLIKGAIF